MFGNVWVAESQYLNVCSWPDLQDLACLSAANGYCLSLVHMEIHVMLSFRSPTSVVVIVPGEGPRSATSVSPLIRIMMSQCG